MATYPARSGADRAAEQRALIADQHTFARELYSALGSNMLDDLLIRDLPDVSWQLLHEAEAVVRQSARTGNMVVFEQAMNQLETITTMIQGDAQQYGMALGAVVERFRLGFLDHVTRMDREATAHEVDDFKRVAELREQLQEIGPGPDRAKRGAA